LLLGAATIAAARAQQFERLVVTPTAEASASCWALQRMSARAALIWALVSGIHLGHACDNPSTPPNGAASGV